MYGGSPSCNISFTKPRMELPWRSGSVIDCHATAPGSIPGRCIYRASRPSQRAVNGGAVS